MSRGRGPGGSAGPPGPPGPPLPERPQSYEDRVERALEALSCGLQGARTLAEYLLAQQAPEWRNSAPMTQAAADFRKAVGWLCDVLRPPAPPAPPAPPPAPPAGRMRGHRRAANSRKVGIPAKGKEDK